MTVTPCGICSGATRDAAAFCDRCGDALAGDLRDLCDWLAEALEDSATGQRGTRYDTNTGGGRAKGGTKDLQVGWHALDARRRVFVALREAAGFCVHRRVRHSSPIEAWVAGATTAEAAEWLLWRVDGMALAPGGHEHAQAIMAATFAARRVVDCPPKRQWLGSCLSCGRGRLLALEGKPMAVCDQCDAAFDADEVRGWLLDQLDDKLMTMAELADISTYLGLRADRERVRKRLNTWARRGQITPEPAVTGEVVYRFGPIWRRLVAADSGVTQATL